MISVVDLFSLWEMLKNKLGCITDIVHDDDLYVVARRIVIKAIFQQIGRFFVRNDDRKLQFMYLLPTPKKYT